MPKDPTPEVTTQNEYALHHMRQQPLVDWLLEGKQTSLTSQVSRTDKGLDIKTRNDKTGETQEEIVSGTKVPWAIKSFDADITVKYVPKPGEKGKPDEHGHINFSYDLLDFNRTDKGHVRVAKLDAAGKPVVESKGEYNQLDHGHVGNTTECDYILHDPRLTAKYGGDLKLNQTVTHPSDGSTEYRSVIRDQKNKVLGIVDQYYKTDANGDMTQLFTQVRKSEKQGQILPPEN